MSDRAAADPLTEKNRVFSETPNGVYMERRKYSREVDHSSQKLCFVATDLSLLVELLYALSEREDCYYVKYSVVPCDGMYLGRCFMLTDQAVGELWAQLKPHPRLMCSVQDDAFTERFRRTRR